MKTFFHALGRTPAAPERALAAQGRAPVPADRTRAVPGQTPAAPGQTPAAPDQTPAAPGQTPVAPGRAPAARDRTPAAPGLAPVVPSLTPAAPGRIRSAWRAAHAPVPGVSRRMRLLALAVPSTVLPASLWRLPAAFDAGIGIGERAYIVFLSLFSEAVAFTAIGLVAPWGEVVPSWVPALRGRRIPPAAVLVPAALGATALTVLWTGLSLAIQLTGTTIRGDTLPADFPSEVGGWTAFSFYVCYAPLVLWGPFLGVLTVAYGRRRRDRP
ncbi:hypothetical protein ACFV2S_20420 [Streptomyces sp. NPDC059695]|uniref:hypothetical protein n=1 Tax=Streptomyces sp. NPDC059695 TaxID=3346910 RepID=UPI0036A5891B